MVNKWVTLQSQVPDISKISALVAGTPDPVQGCMPAWEMGLQRDIRTNVMPFVSLIVLWHQYLIFSLRIFPIVSAKPRKLLIAGKGHIYTSVRARAEWCSVLIQLVPSAKSRRHWMFIIHPSSILPCPAGQVACSTLALLCRRIQPALHTLVCLLGQVIFLPWALFSHL